MSSYKDLEYWARRLNRNTQPLAPGDQKLMIGSIMRELESLQAQVKELNETIQSMGSKASRPNGKKLDARRDSEGDSPRDA